jgi:hypothetical protein
MDANEAQCRKIFVHTEKRAKLFLSVISSGSEKSLFRHKEKSFLDPSHSFGMTEQEQTRLLAEK